MSAPQRDCSKHLQLTSLWAPGCPYPGCSKACLWVASIQGTEMVSTYSHIFVHKLEVHVMAQQRIESVALSLLQTAHDNGLCPQGALAELVTNVVGSEKPGGTTIAVCAVWRKTTEKGKRVRLWQEHLRGPGACGSCGKTRHGWECRRSAGLASPGRG